MIGALTIQDTETTYVNKTVWETGCVVSLLSVPLVLLKAHMPKYENNPVNETN